MPQWMRPEEIRQLDAELDARAGPGHPASALRPGMKSPEDGVVVGRDGFLFIFQGANRWERQYAGEVNILPGWAPRWASVFAARQAEAARRGIGLCNLIVPEKQVIYPDKRWGAEAADTGARRPMTTLAAHLPADAGLLYPAAELKAVRERAPAYFRHDSHWTPSGCCAVTPPLLERLGADVDFEQLPLAVDLRGGALDLTIHMFDSPPPETHLQIVPAGEVVDDNRQLERTGQHTGSTYAVRNPGAPDPRRVLVFGDSYAFDKGLTAALSAVFAEVTFLWSKAVSWDLVEAKRPDLVVWECVERFLNVAPET